MGILGLSADMGEAGSHGAALELKGRKISVSAAGQITLSSLVSMTEVSSEALGYVFPVPCLPPLPLLPHILTLRCLFLLLPFTFIWCHHSEREVMASLVSQGKGLYPVLGVLKEEEREGWR